MLCSYPYSLPVMNVDIRKETIVTKVINRQTLGICILMHYSFCSYPPQCFAFTIRPLSLSDPLGPFQVIYIRHTISIFIWPKAAATTGYHSIHSHLIRQLISCVDNKELRDYWQN